MGGSQVYKVKNKVEKVARKTTGQAESRQKG